MSQIATRTDAPKPTLRAGGAIAGIIPQSIEEAYRLSDAIHQAGMAPFGLDTPQKVMIAMMTGLELEMPPMQAVQSIAVINNRPCMWGDALIGVVRKSPLCLYVREWIDGDGDARIARCETKRKGEEHPVVRSFSVDDAKRAKLWSTDAMVTKRAKGGGTYEKENDSPWYRYPQRMLQMRARAWCLRDTYADVLKGMQVREEVEDYQHEPPAPVELRREPSRFAARLTSEPQVPSEAREGFRQDHIDTELGARQEPVEEIGDAVVGASAEEEQDATGEVDPDAPASDYEAPFDAQTADKLTRYARDVLTQAVSDGDAGLRKDRIGKAHTRWRSEFDTLPTEAADVAKRALSAAQSIVKGDTDLEAATNFLADEIGVEAAALMPGAA